MGAFRTETIAHRGSDMARRVLRALSVAHEERSALRPGRTDNAEAETLKTAFESRGYRFRIEADSWRVARGDMVSAASTSILPSATRSLMLMEALAAAARAEWAVRHGLLASGATDDVRVGMRAMDVSTGLRGTLEEVAGPYATFLSDPLPLSLPAWAWRAMPGVSEGDRVRLYSVVRSMALVEEGAPAPGPTWSAVVSAARGGVVPFQEDEVAPQPGRI